MRAAVTAQTTGGIQKDVLAPGQRSGAAVQRFPHPVTGGEAGTAQIRQGDAARQRGQRPQPRAAYLMAVRQRPQIEGGKMRAQQGRIHEGRMVGQDEHTPAPLTRPRHFGLQDVQSFQPDTVTQGEQAAAAAQQHAGEQDADTRSGPGAARLPCGSAAAFHPAPVAAIIAIRKSGPETTGKKDGPNQGKTAQQHVGHGRRQEGQQGIDRPGQGHAGKGKEIAGAEDAALFLRCREQLDLAGHRHDVQAAADAHRRIAGKEQAEAEGLGRDGHATGDRQQKTDTGTGAGHAPPPVPTGTAGRQTGPGADAQHEPAGQQAGHGGAKAQLGHAVGIDLQQDEGGQGIEKGIGAQAPEDAPAGTQMPQVAGGIQGPQPGEGRQIFLAGGSGPVRDEEHGQQAQHRHAHGHGSHQPVSEGDLRGEPLPFQGPARQRDAQQDGRRGGQLEQGVDAGHVLAGEQFRQGAVEGRAEQGGAGPHAEEHGQHAAPVQLEQPPAPGQHGTHFQGLGRQNQAALGVAVGQPARPGGEQDEGQRKKHGAPGLHGRMAHTHGQQQDGLLEEIVVEGAEGVAHPQRDGLSQKSPAHAHSLQHPCMAAIPAQASARSGRAQERSPCSAASSASA